MPLRDIFCSTVTMVSQLVEAATLAWSHWVPEGSLRKSSAWVSGLGPEIVDFDPNSPGAGVWGPGST